VAQLQPFAGGGCHRRREGSRAWDQPNALGIGLAANQVGELVRVAVVEVGPNHPRYPYKPPIPLTVIVNPVIEPIDAETVAINEGCLSVPEVYDKVSRHARVRVRALDRSGEVHEFEAEGLLSVAVQHEMDHLLGKVFVEYLSPLKRTRIKTRMLKKSRDEAKV